MHVKMLLIPFGICMVAIASTLSGCGGGGGSSSPSSTAPSIPSVAMAHLAVSSTSVGPGMPYTASWSSDGQTAAIVTNGRAVTVQPASGGTTTLVAGSAGTTDKLYLHVCDAAGGNCVDSPPVSVTSTAIVPVTVPDTFAVYAAGKAISVSVSGGGYQAVTSATAVPIFETTAISLPTISVQQFKGNPFTVARVIFTGPLKEEIRKEDGSLYATQEIVIAGTHVTCTTTYAGGLPPEIVVEDLSIISRSDLQRALNGMISTPFQALLLDSSQPGGVPDYATEQVAMLATSSILAAHAPGY